MSTGNVLYPRAEVDLDYVIQGESDGRDPRSPTRELSESVIPHHAALTRHSHTKASEATFQIEGSALPFNPDRVLSCFASLYMGLADTPTGSIREPKNLRFVGYVDEYQDDLEGRVMSFSCRDLRAVLMDHEFRARKMKSGQIIDPTPRYSDTLRQSIERILSVVPGCDEDSTRKILVLADSPGLKDENGADLGLDRLAEGRMSGGPINLPNKCTAWQAIEHVCGIAARHVGVRLGEIIVRTPDQVFNSRSSKYVFEFGTESGNVLEPRRHKSFHRVRKGVRLIAWNPETRKRMEAVYPSEGDLAVNQRATPRTNQHPRHRTKPPAPPPPQERDIFSIGSAVVTDEALAEKARAIYLERSRQEMDGSIATPIWNDDVLNLDNGDRVTIRLSPDLEAELRALGPGVPPSQFLQQRLGINRDAADELARISRTHPQELYYVRRVTHEVPSRKLTTIEFINLIDINGALP